MNPLTGGCHFDHGCGRYNSGCGACPQIGSMASGDLSHQIWQRKHAVFSHLQPDRLHIIALNCWMADTVKQSPLLGRFPVTVVPNGIETDVFAPLDMRLARDILDIPQNARVILFAADSVTNRRKGFELLTEALNGIPDSSNLFLLSVGSGTPHIETHVPHLHVGHVQNNRLLALIYSAADVYVIPSLQDNQPNTVLEAMACGTPVVGFDVGGIPDMVRPGTTGVLAPAGDVTALRAGMVDLLDHHEKRLFMAAACRRTVVQEYTLETQVRRYADLYTIALERIFPNRLVEAEIHSYTSR